MALKKRPWFLTFVFSLMPLSVLDWLLTIFAWLQLQVLAIKGQYMREERQEVALAAAKKKKMKKLKNMQRLRRKSESIPSHSAASAAAAAAASGGGGHHHTPNKHHHPHFVHTHRTFLTTPVVTRKRSPSVSFLHASGTSIPVPMYTHIPSTPGDNTLHAPYPRHSIHNSSAHSSSEDLKASQSEPERDTSPSSLSGGDQVPKISVSAELPSPRHLYPNHRHDLHPLHNNHHPDSSTSSSSSSASSSSSHSLKRIHSEADALYLKGDPSLGGGEEDESLLLLHHSNEQHRKEFEGFLRGVKDIKDVQNWLKHYSKDAPRKIAIVKISRRILETSYGMEQAASALSFMYRFGLQPIVVHGGLNELAKYSQPEIVEKRKEFSITLKETIRKYGVGATIFQEDVCQIEPFIDSSSSSSSPKQGSSSSSSDHASDDDDDLSSGLGLGFHVPGGLKLKLKNFDFDRLTQALDKGKIPIWDSVADLEGVAIPINSDVTVYELAKIVKPYRIIFACNDGGIIDKDNKPIPVVYMDKDYEELMHAPWVTLRRRVLLEQMKRIVSCVPSSTTVVVTSMEAVTHQLFYPRLADETIVKRCEENKVYVYKELDDSIDMHKLRELVEDSFGRPLVDDYFEYLHDHLYKLYLVTSATDEYQGCAIITLEGSSEEEIPYLCKFCVKRAAQGLGLGDLIWRSLQRDETRLFWRSRNNNPLNPWYFQRAQGSFRGDPHFTVFWYGDDNFEDGVSIINSALAKPVTVLPYPKKESFT